MIIDVCISLVSFPLTSLQSGFATTTLLQIFPFSPPILVFLGSNVEGICKKSLLKSFVHIFLLETLFSCSWGGLTISTFLTTKTLFLPRLTLWLSPRFSPQFSVHCFSHAHTYADNPFQCLYF